MRQISKVWARSHDRGNIRALCAGLGAMVYWIRLFLGVFWLVFTQKWSILNLKIFQITKTRFLSKFEIFSRFLSKIRLNQPQTRRLLVLLG